MNIAIVYGSNLGNTAAVAQIIAKAMGISEEHVHDVANVQPEDLNGYDAYIIGTSTWGIGDMADSWQEFDFKKFQVKGKTIALFGLGDSQIYAFTFCNGLGKLFRTLGSGKGWKHVGKVPAKNYTFGSSEAVVNEEFVGLPVDYDNYPEKAEAAVADWVKKIKPLFA